MLSHITKNNPNSCFKLIYRVALHFCEYVPEILGNYPILLLTLRSASQPKYRERLTYLHKHKKLLGLLDEQEKKISV
jgi:hypothetical protein